MSIFNNLVSGPGWPGNYVQPDYRIPSASMQPASFPVGANVLNISEPVATYLQPGVTVTSPLPAWVNSGGAGPSVV